MSVFNVNGQCTGTSRTMDSVCEDAQHSGELVLSSRKLKEYPKITSKYALVDINCVDLSKNRYADIPVEVCDLLSLEHLNCYHNVIRSIPDKIGQLQALVHLNLSRNQLTTIPSSVCQLRALEVLLVSNNKLVSLPEEVGQLEHLTDLDASCNEMTHIPPQVGDLQALLSLNLRRNLLVNLPSEICKLRLRKIDISANRISQIPLHFCYSDTLEEIVVNDNPLTSPPAVVCAKGRIHIMKFLHCMSLKDGRRRGPFDDTETPKQLSRFSPIQSKITDELPQPMLQVSPTQQPQQIVIDRSEIRIPGLPKEQQHREPIEIEIKRQNSASSQSQLDLREQDDRGYNILPSTGHGVKPGRARIDDFFGSGTSFLDERNVDSVSTTGAIDLSKRSNFYKIMQTGEELRQRHEDMIAAQRKEVQRIRGRMEEGRQNIKQYQKDVVYDFIKRTQGVEVRESVYPEQPVMANPMTSPLFEPNPQQVPTGGSVEDNRLPPRCQKVLESMSGVLSHTDPGFTIRRNLHHASEEMQLIDHLRQIIETNLKVVLPENITAALRDGVVLCHLANHIRPGSVPSIHVPSPAVPKLTTAKCRRNVENFLSACLSIGVPQSKICSPLAVLEERRIPEVAHTVLSLVLDVGLK